MLGLAWVYIYIYWLMVWNICSFFHILGIMIPTDFHIFQRGRYTTNQVYIIISVITITHDHY